MHLGFFKYNFTWYCFYGAIENTAALIRPGDMPLFKSVVTQFTDVYTYDNLFSELHNDNKCNHTFTHSYKESSHEIITNLDIPTLLSQRANVVDD